ncbi:MAG: hypothetical protein KKA73_28135 [Chloroflexi bacterium]|nr:hypothetical protein [Chloroflexota bacterium]MBU1751565.1 hypothetical protein [Chloroflexota bacterium]
MAIPFSRSIRSLQADDFRLSLAGLVIAGLLFTAWAAWFFFAQITLYETGQIVRVTNEGLIVADFAPEALKRVRQGQSALLRFDVAAQDEEAGPIPAIVMTVTSQAPDKKGQVALYPLPEAVSRVPFQDNPTGRVEIEVEYLSPAALILRASGQLLDTPPVSTSPRNP